MASTHHCTIISTVSGAQTPQFETVGASRQYDSRKAQPRFLVWGNIQLMLAQGFANGFIFRDSDGETCKKAYVFLNNGSFVREGY